jgi:hypothetical protein
MTASAREARVIKKKKMKREKREADRCIQKGVRGVSL